MGFAPITTFSTPNIDYSVIYGIKNTRKKITEKTEWIVLDVSHLYLKRYP